jgi:2-phosphoglycerate kinase
MIYLIGGPPKCGKTTLAKKLSKEFGLFWISADTLQSVAKAYIDEKDLPEKFPWSEVKKNVKGSNDIAYGQYPAEDIVNLYRKQAKSSYPAIEMVVASELNDRNDYIIEGFQIEPELAASLIQKYKEVKAVFLTKTDKGKFVSDIEKTTTPNDWIIARTKDKKTYEKIAEMITRYSQAISDEAQKYNQKVFNLDDDFQKTLQEATKYLMD